MREWRTGLLELIGDGPIVGATTLVAWSHQGRVGSEAAFAMPAGVVPIPASPGMTTRHRLNGRGDRRLDCALHSIAIQRQRHDPRPTTKAYIERRRAEGTTDRGIRRPHRVLSDSSAISPESSTAPSSPDSTAIRSILSKSRSRHRSRGRFCAIDPVPVHTDPQSNDLAARAPSGLDSRPDHSGGQRTGHRHHEQD